MAQLQNWAFILFKFILTPIFSWQKRGKGTSWLCLLWMPQSKPVQSAEPLHDTWGCFVQRFALLFFNGYVLWMAVPCCTFPMWRSGEGRGGKQARFCAIAFMRRGFHPSDQCIFTTGLCECVCVWECLCGERIKPTAVSIHTFCITWNLFFFSLSFSVSFFFQSSEAGTTHECFVSSWRGWHSRVLFPALYSLHENNTYWLNRKILGVTMTKTIQQV